MDILGRYEDVDKKLFEIGKKLKPFFYCNPVNQENQKELFLSGIIENPEFVYMRVDPDESPEKIEKELRSLSVKSGSLKAIYRSKIKEMLLINDIIKHRGDSSKIQSITMKIYGAPDKKTISEAQKILLEKDSADSSETVDFSFVKKELIGSLARNNLNDWSIEEFDSSTTMVNTELKKIFVGTRRRYTSKQVKQLVVHEVLWHVARAANGYNQRIKIFALGFPGYQITEEGGAIFLEDKLRVLNGALRRVAANVLAENSLMKKKPFRKTFEEVKKYGFSDEDSWDITLRAYRAGGLVKDHIYLRGYLDMKSSIKDDDLEILFCGKIGLKDIKLVRKLIADKIISKPFTIPEEIRLSLQSLRRF